MALTQAPEELLDKSLTSELTITTADNTTQLTLTSTDADGSVGPRFDLKRDSASPAADDTLGQIRWLGEDSGGAALSYTHIASYIVDPTDGSEDGKFEIDVRKAGTARSRLLLDENETVFNQESQDIDFRVESDSSANMLVVDAGNNKVLIEAQNTDTVSNAATMIAAGVLEINGNAGEGSDHIKMGAMADGTGNQFIEATNSGATSAYKVMINPVNGGNLYSGGNLEFPSGKGIDFSATGDATGSSSELLDDYEEGSWTPTISVGSVSGNQCQYTKVGNLVTLRGNLADITDNTTNSDIIITGLPYTAGSNNRAIGSAMFRYFTRTDAIHMNAYLGQNDSTLSFYWSYNSSSAWTVVEYDQGTQANMDIMFTISYITT